MLSIGRLVSDSGLTTRQMDYNLQYAKMRYIFHANNRFEVFERFVEQFPLFNLGKISNKFYFNSVVASLLFCQCKSNVSNVLSCAPVFPCERIIRTTLEFTQFNEYIYIYIHIHAHSFSVGWITKQGWNLFLFSL